MVSDIAMLSMFIIFHYDEHCACTIIIISGCVPVGVVREKWAWSEIVKC